MAALTLIWRRRAAADLLEITQHIARDNPIAADALRNDIRARVSNLIDNPRAYRTGRMAGTREMVVRPNYLVVYRESKGAVSILRVLHTARQWP